MKWIFEEEKTGKFVGLERDQITAGQMKEIYRDGFRLTGIIKDTKDGGNKDDDNQSYKK